MITGATILCFSFLGFDGISSLSEETPDAGRVIPRAIFLTALIGGAIFIIGAYFLQLFFPDIACFHHPDASQSEIMLYVAEKLFQSVVLCFSCVTGCWRPAWRPMLGCRALLYVMGRDGVFPVRFFGFVHPTWSTPALNVLLVGMIALSTVSFDLVTATALINFGALVALSFVNLSVIAQFWLREQRRCRLRDHLQYLVLPLVSVLTVGLRWLNLEASSMMLGLSWGAAGVAYLLLMTRGFRRAVPQYREELAR